MAAEAASQATREELLHDYVELACIILDTYFGGPVLVPDRRLNMNFMALMKQAQVLAAELPRSSAALLELSDYAPSLYVGQLWVDFVDVSISDLTAATARVQAALDMEAPIERSGRFLIVGEDAARIERAFEAFRDHVYAKQREARRQGLEGNPNFTKAQVHRIRALELHWFEPVVLGGLGDGGKGNVARFGTKEIRISDTALRLLLRLAAALQETDDGYIAKGDLVEEELVPRGVEQAIGRFRDELLQVTGHELRMGLIETRHGGWIRLSTLAELVTVDPRLRSHPDQSIAELARRAIPRSGGE